MEAMGWSPSWTNRMISLEGSRMGFRVMGSWPKNCSINWVRGTVWIGVARWAWMLLVSMAKGLIKDSNLLVLSGTKRWDQKESLILE